MSAQTKLLTYHHNLLIVWLITTVCLVFTPAAATTNQLVSWNTLHLDLPITEKIFFRETLSTRFDENFTSMDTQLIRNSFNYEFNRDKIATVAYDWFKRFDSSSGYESRLWQQFYYRHDTGVDKLRVFHRVRVDERMVENTDTQVRARYMIAGEYALSDSLTLTINDEILVNLNSNQRAEAGLEQNRFRLYQKIKPTNCSLARLPVTTFL
jgi:hypothetical protein